MFNNLYSLAYTVKTREGEEKGNVVSMRLQLGIGKRGEDESSALIEGSGRENGIRSQMKKNRG